MGFETDFLPVGKEKPGDAILIRYGNLYGPRSEQKVILVDGGYPDTAQVILNHMKAHYGGCKIDLVVSTHPDQDHVGGLETILTECQVGELWMHRPWTHTQDLAKAFVNGRVTDQSVKESLRKSLEEARSIEAIATSRGIPITEPFTGTNFDRALFVLGPTEGFYESLLPGFRCTPQAKQEPNLLKFLVREAVEVVKKVAEAWHIETLGVPEEDTSAENNSSAILLFHADTQSVLLTADAGVPALTAAIGVLEAAKYDLSRIKCIQVPHHGSARNVCPDLLNRLLGQRVAQGVVTRSAYVSVTTDDDPKHPAKKVINAFRRRGAPVTCTAGLAKCFNFQSPAATRPGWGPSTPMPFYAEVED